jgi:enterochelin esterase-like enzyme
MPGAGPSVLADAIAAVELEIRRLMPGMPERDVPRFAASIALAEPYALGPDSQSREGVPQGAVTTHLLEDCVAWPGVAHDYRVYVSAQCRPEQPAAVLVFQDGARYLGPEANVPAVLDNLVAAGELPPAVAVFVEPGQAGPGLPVYGGGGNRSVEYDSTGDAYVRFLVDDLLPLVARVQPLTQDPAQRVICGLSSGGQCAFAAAWHRPDVFGNVISHCGSFVAIRGGHEWPFAVRRDERRPLRIFLQTGARDLDIVFGDWLHANRALAAALEYRGYDYQLLVGEGGHSLRHGGAILPETLRWLWRDR